MTTKRRHDRHDEGSRGFHVRGYEGKDAFFAGARIDLSPGFCAIVGESGVGKMTLIETLAYLERRRRAHFDRRRAWLFGFATVAALTAVAPMARAQDMFENGGASESDPSATSQNPKSPKTPSTWEESDPAPPGYRVVRRLRRNLIVQGAGLVVLAYSFSCFAAAAGPETRALWVPVAGPYIQILQTHSSPGDIVQTNGLATTLLVFDALFQTIGAAMITYGLVVPEGHLVKDDGGPKIAATPMTFWRGGGIGIVGSF